jgi:PAS domain S-box-containing protein
MQEVDKTKEELATEVVHLRQRVAELEQSEIKYKQAEDELRKSEERYRKLADNIADVFFAMDKDLRYTYWNRASENLTGIPAKDALGKSLYEIFPEVKGTTAEEVYREALKTQQPQTVVQQYRLGEKNLVFEISVYPLRDGLSVFVKDITERELAEEALRKSEEKYRTVVEISPDGIAIASKGRHIFANKSLAKIVGVSSPDELLGKPLMDYIHPDYRKIVRKRLEQQTKHEELAPLREEKMLRADGTVIHVEVAAAPLKYEGEQAVLAVIRDITDRKQAEEALKLERDRLQMLMEGLTHIEVGIDVVGVDYRVRLQNRVLEERFGDLTGKLCYENYLGLKEPCDFCPMIKAVENNRVENAELTGGDGRNYELISAPLPNPDGTVDKAIEVVRDITERKQMEEELRKSEERFRTIFEGAPDAIFLTDPESGEIIDANPAASELLLRPREEIVGLHQSKLHPPQLQGHEKKKFVDYVQYVRAKEQTHPIESTVVRSDGSTVPVEILAQMIHIKGRPIFRGTFRDITERKHAEKALRESEERFRTIFETAQDFIFLKDRDSKFTAVNPAMEQLYGVPASELIGKTGAALFGEEMAARLRERDVRVLSGEIIVEEHPGPVKGNTDIHHIIKVPIRNSAGEIIGLCGIGRDITKRKQMEEALVESEERFRTIVEQAAEAIIAHDLDGQVLLVNSLACEYTGYSQAELLSMNVLGLDHEILEKDYKKRYWENLQVGKYVKVEATHKRKDGSTYPAEVYLAKILFKAQPIILCLARDITQRKQMEEALRQSEEKYRLLLDNIDLGINLIDADHTIIMANASVGKRWKKSVNDIIGKKCFQVFEHRDTVCPNCPGVQTMATGQPAEIVHEEVQDGQEHFHVRLQTFPHVAQDGTVIGFTEIAEDITDRKQAEKALEESENRFRLLVEHSVDAFILHDIDGRILDVNQHTCESLGYTREELLGLCVHDIDQNVAAGKHIKQWEQMVPGEPVTLEGVHRRKDGTTFPVEIRLAVFELDGDKRMLGLVRDVTERKQAEKALSDREAFNYALFHYNPVETIAVDLEGRVTAFNLAKEKAGDRLPTIGDRMYKDYAGKHEIDMRAELMTCIRSGESRAFPERKYYDKYLNITVSPFSQGAIIISEDITERRRVEEALRASEQFSSTLLNDAPHPILVVNPDTSLRYVNPAFEKLTGFSAAELLGRKAPYPWWGEEIISETTRGLKRAMHQGIQRIENLFQTKSGEAFWVEITAEPVMHDGKVLYLLTNWVDITDRKQAEELLQKERDRFYSILERAPYGVMVVDAAGHHSFLNTEFTKITGYTLADIPTSREWWHLAYPDQHYRNMVMETWEKNYTQRKADETFRKEFGRVFSRAFNVMCKDGATKEIEFRTSVIGDEGTVFMLSDITERQRMNALLETAAAEWRTTFDAINDAVCLLDQHGKIIRCNNAMLQVMGKPFSQITNHHCWEVIHGVSEAPHSCPIVLVGKTHHRENEVMFKDSRWFNISMDPLLDENGNFIGGVHIMSDITDRMRIQNELQDSREQLRNLTVYLQSVREQERTNIAREIHDELAQALTALKMDVSWLDHRLPIDAQSLSEKTKSMSKLIDSTIQTVKRISAELRPGILDDLGLVAAIEWQAEEFQNRTGISCNFTVDPQDLTIDQDRSTAIFRIFQETLTNVARHARATRVAVSLKERAGKLTLRVKDNGIGITEEQISDSRSFGFIGMRERVIPWNGKISFKGIPDKGTTVIVRVGLDTGKRTSKKTE